MTAEASGGLQTNVERRRRTGSHQPTQTCLQKLFHLRAASSYVLPLLLLSFSANRCVFSSQSPRDGSSAGGSRQSSSILPGLQAASVVACTFEGGGGSALVPRINS